MDLKISTQTTAPQPTSNPQAYVLAQNTIPDVKPKSGYLKKLFLGLGIFVGLIVFLTLAVIFIVPKVLSLTAKDIPPINDRDMLPIALEKLSDQDNALPELDQASAAVYEPCQVLGDTAALRICSKEEIPQILDKNKDVFAKWDDAAQKKGIQDSLYLDPTTPAVYKSVDPHKYTGLQKVARLNVMRGFYQIKQGFQEEGINTLTENLAIGQKLQQSGSGLVSNLVGTSIMAIGFTSLQMVTPELKLSPSDSIAWNNILDAFSFDTNGLKESLKQEYFTQTYLIDALATGKVDKIYPADSPDPETQAFRAKLKDKVNNNYMFQPNKTKLLLANSFKPQIDNIDKPCADIKSVTIQKPRFNTSDTITAFFKENGVGELMANLQVIDYGGLARAKCTQTIELSATKLIFVLQAYRSEKGSLPTSLDLLVPTYIPSIPEDPYDNTSLKYSVSNKIIYSVGENHKDDGGQGKIKDLTALDYIITIEMLDKPIIATVSSTPKITTIKTPPMTKPTANLTPSP